MASAIGSKILQIIFDNLIRMLPHQYSTESSTVTMMMILPKARKKSTLYVDVETLERLFGFFKTVPCQHHPNPISLSIIEMGVCYSNFFLKYQELKRGLFFISSLCKENPFWKYLHNCIFSDNHSLVYSKMSHIFHTCLFQKWAAST